ncbi:MAG: MFS transporter [Candidatus Sumerlaeaceae bacterium]
MSDTVPEPPARIHPRAAFQHRDFRVFQASKFISTIGWLMQVTAVGYQVYSITHSKLDLGYIGLASFLPAILFSLLTGHVADRFDRRGVMMVCMSIMIAGSLALMGISLMEIPPAWPFLSHIHGMPTAQTWPFLVILFVTGAAHAFYGPASQALMPQLVPQVHFANAVAWNSTIWQASAILGPAVGGLVYYQMGGPAAVYGADAALTSLAFLLMGLLHMRTGRMEMRAASWSTLLAGLHFIWKRKIILGAISMDLFAVLLGGATALLPVYAQDILHVGEAGFGLMRSAPAMGAAITALIVTHLPPMQRAGATMLVCVAIFGVATIAFGVSTNFWFSMACLVTMGAADMVSVVIRHTVVQMLTPPEMRGRVSAVNLVFIGASNELGEFESGVTAHWFGTVPAVVIGGVGTLMVVGLWAFMFPQLRKYKRLDVAEDIH